jgi:hypothetical protein
MKNLYLIRKQMAAEKSLPFHFPRKHIKDNKIKPTIIIRTALLSAKNELKNKEKLCPSVQIL